MRANIAIYSNSELCYSNFNSVQFNQVPVLRLPVRPISEFASSHLLTQSTLWAPGIKNTDLSCCKHLWRYDHGCYINSIYSLSLRFNGHFPGEPGLAGIYWSKGRWRWWWQLDYWSYKSCKAPLKSSPPTNQHPVFYRPDAIPVAQPTVSKHWRENIRFHGLAYPKLTWESSNFVSDH